MNQHERRARAITMRKGQPLRRTRTVPVPNTVVADLDAIDTATEDPAIHAATARIRAALTDTETPARPTPPAKEA
ncbi:hypothetical protein ACIQNG_25540 [Streptomyces sp. NPDC091377]|uniref:hypothetical protein n=1 Tax=Streptomyces sp. NPDC091377 TaxID=3365995 RepID=UPI00382DF3A7